MSKARTAITPTRDENYAEWYQQVVAGADLAESSPVRGCMIIRPWGYALWENMQRALDDIVQVESEGGFEVRRYVMDRTVIEDTESSLDLVAAGWHLLNYPERLSYSATPPDFGALTIQRRRWANGGLLILPKLATVRGARVARGEGGSWLRTLLRLNYLASTCWSSVALLFLLYFPFASSLLSPLVLLLACCTRAREQHARPPARPPEHICQSRRRRGGAELGWAELS